MSLDVSCLSPADLAVLAGALDVLEYGPDKQERARRQLLVECPTPADLAAKFDPTFIRTEAGDLISSRIVGAMTTYDGRLTVSQPPQTGKSLTLRWTCLWLLFNDPDTRIVFASYAERLARTSGRIIRSLVEMYGGPYGLRLDKSHADAADWQIEGYLGGVYAVGTGSSLTGRASSCVTADSAIVTRGGRVTAANLAAMPDLPEVLSWNHTTSCTEWRQVQATCVTEGKEVLELRTTGGRRLRCTDDHLVYVCGRGYIAASQLRPGDRLVAASTARPHEMCALCSPVRATPVVSVARKKEVGTGTLLQSTVSHRSLVRDLDLCPVWPQLPEDAVRGHQGNTPRLRADVLLQAVPAHGRVGGVRVDTEVRDVRQTETAAERSKRLEVLFYSLPPADYSTNGVSDLRSVRGELRVASVRASKEEATRVSRLLQQEMRSGSSHPAWPRLQEVQRSYPTRKGAAVLLGCVSADDGTSKKSGSSGSYACTEDLPNLRQGIPAEDVAVNVLRSVMCKLSTFIANGRQGKLPLSGRHELRRLVPEDATGDPRTRWWDLSGVQDSSATAGIHTQWSAVPADSAGCAPHKSRSPGQQAGESDFALSVLPHNPPQVNYDTVSVVRRVRGERVAVYDFQVEGNRNFFADEILVHNCMIVDDPHPSMQAADSSSQRGNVLEWWSSTARTRLAPGAPVVGVATRWSEFDLISMFIGEGWPSINIPAQADGKTPDALERPVGEYLITPRGTTVPDWEKTRAEAGERTWASLYQGRPAPLEGGIFKTDWFSTWRVPDAPPGCLPPTVVVDPADNEGDGDEAGIILATSHPALGKVYLLDDLSAPMTVARWARVALLTCVRRGAPTLAYEKSLSQLPKRIREAWQQLYQQALALHRTGGDVEAAVIRLSRPDDTAEAREFTTSAVAEIAADFDAVLAVPESGPQLRAIVAKGSKALRMQLVAPMFETGRAVFVGHHPQAEHQLSTWQPGQDSPDRADAITHVCMLLSGASPAVLSKPGDFGRVLPTRSTRAGAMSRSSVLPRSTLTRR